MRNTDLSMAASATQNAVRSLKRALDLLGPLNSPTEYQAVLALQHAHADAIDARAKLTELAQRYAAPTHLDKRSADPPPVQGRCPVCGFLQLTPVCRQCDVPVEQHRAR